MGRIVAAALRSAVLVVGLFVAGCWPAMQLDNNAGPTTDVRLSGIQVHVPRELFVLLRRDAIVCALRFTKFERGAKESERESPYGYEYFAAE